MAPRIALPAFFLVVLAIASLSMVQGPLTVQPTGWFDLQDRLPAAYGIGQVDRFVAASTGLYFLTTGAAGEGRFILQTGPDGAFKKALALPRNAFSFDVDDAGNVFVLEGGGLVVFDPEGSAAGPPRPANAQAVCALDGRPVAISADGTVSEMREREPRRVASLPGGLRGMLVASGAGRQVVALDGIQARLYLLDVGARRTRAVDLDAAEIRDARTQYIGTYSGGPNAAPVITHSMAVARDGRIYVAISGLSVAAGAPILELSPEGAVTRVLRCLLPPKRGSGRWMAPEFIGVVDRRLFIVDPSGRVACYDR